MVNQVKFNFKSSKADSNDNYSSKFVSQKDNDYFFDIDYSWSSHDQYFGGTYQVTLTIVDNNITYVFKK
jgi:hypothetical protein